MRRVRKDNRLIDFEQVHIYCIHCESDVLSINGDKMPLYKGYDQPGEDTQPDTILATIPSDDLDKDYQRLN